MVSPYKRRIFATCGCLTQLKCSSELAIQDRMDEVIREIIQKISNPHKCPTFLYSLTSLAQLYNVMVMGVYKFKKRICPKIIHHETVEKNSINSQNKSHS